MRFLLRLALVALSVVPVFGVELEIVDYHRVEYPQEQFSAFPAVAARSTDDFFGLVDPDSTYESADLEGSSLRVAGHPLGFGMASNRVTCIDLVSAGEQWDHYLDHYVLQLIQTRDRVLALTVNSLYAFDLDSGRPLWQIDTRTGEAQDRITLRRRLEFRSWDGEESMVEELSRVRERMPLAGFRASSDTVLLSLESGRIIAVDREGAVLGRDLLATGNDGARPMCFHSVRGDLFVLWSNRRLQLVGDDLTERCSAFLPEMLIGWDRAVCALNDREVVVTFDSLFWIWDTVGGSIREIRGRIPRQKTFHHSIPNGLLSFDPLEGLAFFDRGSLERRWEYRGATVTTWITIVPTRFSPVIRLLAVVSDEEPCLLTLQAGVVSTISQDDGSEILRKEVPFLSAEASSNGAGGDWLHVARVPSYVDRAAQRVYFVTSTLPSGVKGNLQPRDVTDYVVEIAW